MIRHHEIRGDGNESDAERLREIIRLVVTIIDHSGVTQIGICQKVMDNKMREKKRQKDSKRNETDYEKLSRETRRFACPPRKNFVEKKEKVKNET